MQNAENSAARLTVAQGNGDARFEVAVAECINVGIPRDELVA